MVYAAVAFPCACGAPVAPALIGGVTAAAITHRTWSDEWVTVRCALCSRASDWPHPEVGCPCGAVLRVPVRGAAEPGAREDGPPDPGAYGPEADAPVIRAPGAYPAETHPSDACAPGAYPPDGREPDGCETDGCEPDGYAPGAARPRAFPGAFAPGMSGPCEYGPDARESGPSGRAADAGGRTPESTAETDTDVNADTHADAERASAAGPGAGAGGSGATGPDAPELDGFAAEDDGAAGPRAVFRPVTIRTARDAVAASAGYLRWLGFREVVQPEERATTAVDLRGPGLVAQVDPSTRPTGLRAVECLWLNGLSNSAVSVCFALAGYTPEAHERAESLGVPLFVLDLTGTPQPVTTHAGELVSTGAP
ncbi:hypothetical protein ABZ990_19580 [Streptomyces sp. NPDC046203]|uniref:hypothetical protein n=1 Tax=Streptomyces sp. NPDC046203 TaxID=3154602 RepID=UPI0033D9A9E6